jgi:hypothetical protein
MKKSKGSTKVENTDLAELDSLLLRWGKASTIIVNSDCDSIRDLLKKFEANAEYMSRQVLEESIQSAIIKAKDHRKDFKSYSDEWEARKLILKELRTIRANIE